MVSNVTMSPLPGYNMPSGPTAKQKWAEQGTPYGAYQTYFPEGSYHGDPNYFAPAANPSYYTADPNVINVANLSPEWQAVVGNYNAGGPSTGLKPGGNYGGGSGGGTTNPNTGGDVAGPGTNDPLSPYNPDSPNYDPSLGGGNPDLTGSGVQGSNPNGLSDLEMEALGLTGSGNIQDYFQQIYPETVMRDAIRGMGGSTNVADPVMQQLNRMGAGMTYLFPLMGGTFDVSQFDPFVTGMTEGLMGGGGGSMNFQDLSSVMGNIFGGGSVSDLMFAEAYGPSGARSARDILQNILATALPTAMPLPLIGGVQTMLEQGLQDYTDSYVGGIGPGMNPQNFIDFLAGTDFGGLFGY